MIQQLVNILSHSPETVHFSDVINVINASYDFSPTQFSNGAGEDKVVNIAGTNEGSCRIFAFAQLHELSVEQTLHCFGDYYRKDVLENPNGDDHANIRNFIISGWDGIVFESHALALK